MAFFSAEENFRIFSLYLFKIYFYLYVCTPCVSRYLQRLDEGVRFPGAGVIECSKLPDVGSGN